MDFLKLFEKDSEYQTYKSSADYVKPNVSLCENDGLHYDADNIYSKQYLTFDVLEAGTITFGLTYDTDPPSGVTYATIQYSVNGSDTWTSMTATDSQQSLGTFAVGDRVWVKGTNTRLGDENGLSGHNFKGTAKVNVYGNIMSLLYGDNFVGNTTLATSAFPFLFRESNVVSARNLILPAMTLSSMCYAAMFYGCTNLIEAPELPATTLATWCYAGMFNACSKLTTAPKLSATTLASYCYSGMFGFCTNLTNAQTILPATTLAEACYSGMFQGCTSLVCAPVLPSATLVTDCYGLMFSECNNLKYINAAFTSTPGAGYTDNWVANVAPKGVFVKSSSASWNVVGPGGVPNGWEITTTDSGYTKFARRCELIGAGGGGGGVIETTWSDLVDLKTNEELVPGTIYRITDYVTKTTQTDTQSGNHAFDILVMALSESTLDECASAVQHDGDTYFNTSNLGAWEIKYCLENNQDKYGWADTTNGKGVIYYMKDEWNNECPYDFKNIMFKRKLTDGELDSENGTDTFVYTFNLYRTVNADGVIEDASIVGNTLSVYEDGPIVGVFGNKMGVVSEGWVGTEQTVFTYTRFILNDNVFLTVDDGAYNGCYGNTFGDICYQNTFGNGCCENTLGNTCGINTLGNNCYQNTFGNECFENTLGNSCRENTFGNECYNNTFGEGCYSNTFGNECNTNIFGLNCSANTFGCCCTSNTFGYGCFQNTFMNGSYSNILGNNCTYNIFENRCNNNTFGKDYTQYVMIENGNQYITLTSTQTTGNSNMLRNIKISQGVNNTNSTKTISHNTLNDTFQTIYQSANSTVVNV